MKTIKYIIGVLLLVISFFLLIVFASVLFIDTELVTKLLADTIIGTVLILMIILGIKLIKNQDKVSKKDLVKFGIKYTYIIEFPYYGVRENNDEMNYFKGKETYKWFDKDVIDSIEWAWNCENMAMYISDEKIKNKINSMKLHINSNGTCRIFMTTIEELLNEEKEYILKFVSGQASDGLGEGNFDYTDKDNSDYHVSFWKNDDSWYIKYVEEELFQQFLENYKEETKKQCYKVDLINEEPDIKDNKIGGKPYLPIGEKYPLDKSGNPMFLLLQINLKDIDLKGYPKKGVLEIFTTSLNFSLRKSLEHCIRYYDDNLEYQTEFPKMPDKEEYKTEYYVVTKGYKINLSKTIDYMPQNDFRYMKTFEKIANKVLGLNKVEYEEYFGTHWNKFEDNLNESLYLNNPKISIGGYADFTQSDPRGDFPELVKKIECLLKIDAVYDVEKFNIGDSGILFALISKEDLEKENFEDVYVNWDCT